MEYLQSFKKKIIIVVAASLIIAIGLVSFAAIRRMSRMRTDDSRQIMELLCAQYTNQTNGHLETVEQTVDLLYRYALEKLTATGDIYDRENAMSVVGTTRTLAYGAASNISTVHAIYLRLNPDLYGDDSVFFLVQGENGFADVTPTDIRAYDKDDVEHVGWYYLPLENGGPVWLEPYDNQNIDVYMISYSIPIIHEGRYIGVIAIDLDLTALDQTINEISAFDEGYSYLTDRRGDVIFDAVDRSSDAEWLTVSRGLRNGMTLSVTAPYRTIDRSQNELITTILLVSLAILVLAVGIAVWSAMQIHTGLAEALEDVHYSQQAALDAVNQASKAKTDFLSRMSHDIRTPMNAIIGMTAIAGAHLDDTQKVSSCLEKISVSSQHMLGIINDILDMSKIESGKLTIHENMFTLYNVVDELIDLTAAQAKARRHTVLVYLYDIVHEKVAGDESHLQQALVNILSNAVKYTPDGGRITVTVTEKEAKNPSIGWFEFVFEDNGIGMSPELTRIIFEPFERGEDVRVSKIQGTGLGMAITYSIVQSMGGTIQVESEVGKGSKFTVTVPLKLRAEGQSELPEVSGLSVLVADDDPIYCQSVCGMLAELGMVCDGVPSGEQAVEKALARHAQGSDYFAVILDWKMPGLNGLEAARRIADGTGAGGPHLLLTAYDWSEIEKEARQIGFCAFLRKPVFKSGLVHTLRGLLRGEEMPAAAAGSLKELEGQNYAGKRVLLVEDNELNREIAVEIVSITGIDVETAEDGVQAVEMVSTAAPGYYDIILMDVQMPRMNGYEATKAIRALGGWEKVPIIAMTANTFDEDVQAALKAGMNEHLAKPLDLKQLNDMLRRWLSKDRRGTGRPQDQKE